MPRPRRISMWAAIFMAALFGILSVSPVGSTPAAQIMRQERARLTDIAVASTPLLRGETVRAAVELEVDVELHVNANPPTYDYLIPVEVSIAGPEGIEVAQAYYPVPQHETFPYADEPLAVYEGSVVIGVDLAIAADTVLGDQPLEISVRYQACNDRACFAPARATVELPVTVASEGTPAEATGSPLLDRAPFPDS